MKLPKQTKTERLCLPYLTYICCLKICYTQKKDHLPRPKSNMEGILVNHRTNLSNKKPNADMTGSNHYLLILTLTVTDLNTSVKMNISASWIKNRIHLSVAYRRRISPTKICGNKVKWVKNIFHSNNILYILAWKLLGDEERRPLPNDKGYICKKEL